MRADKSILVDEHDSPVARFVAWREGWDDGDRNYETAWSEGCVLILTARGKKQIQRSTGPLKVTVSALRQQSLGKRPPIRKTAMRLEQ